MNKSELISAMAAEGGLSKADSKEHWMHLLHR